MKIVIKRDYGKCEAYRLLHEVGKKIHHLKDSGEIKRVVKLLEESLENNKKELD